MKIKRLYENQSINSVEKIINDYRAFSISIRPFVKEGLDNVGFQYSDFSIKSIKVIHHELLDVFFLLRNNKDKIIFESSISLDLKEILMKLDTKKYNI